MSATFHNQTTILKGIRRDTKMKVHVRMAVMAHQGFDLFTDAKVERRDLSDVISPRSSCIFWTGQTQMLYRCTLVLWATVLGFEPKFKSGVNT